MEMNHVRFCSSGPVCPGMTVVLSIRVGTRERVCPVK
jgi:hypothetical protein